jgi:hypothetical protein
MSWGTVSRGGWGDRCPAREKKHIQQAAEEVTGNHVMRHANGS